MQLNDHPFGPEAVALMGIALDAAWRDIIASTVFSSPRAEAEVQRACALSMMEAISLGERDPAKLQATAISAAYGI